MLVIHAPQFVLPTVLFRKILCAGFLAILIISQPSLAQTPANLPGIVEPVREEALLPEVVDENIVSVPALDKRSQAETGPKIVVNEWLINYDEESLVQRDIVLGAIELAENFLAEAELQNDSGAGLSNGTMLNISQLDIFASLLTEFYRQQGMMLAQAILPPQEVENGVVQIKVFVGKLGQVSAEENSLYRTSQLRRPFLNDIGNVVEVRAVESDILRINDMPGHSAVAVFKPGEDIGTTHMEVTTQQENPIGYFVRADNYGVESTGDIRLLAGVDINNISGHIDRLSVAGVKTFNPGDLRNARVNYEITHPDLVHTLGLGFSKTKYEVQGGGLTAEIEGDTEIGDVYLLSRWIRQREVNFSSRIGLALKRAEVDINSISGGVDRLAVFEVGILYDSVDTRFRGLNRGTLTWYHGVNDLLGSLDGDANNNSLGAAGMLTGQFSKVTAAFNRLQSLSRNHSLLFKFSGQYTEDILSSLEKMSLGGPYTVRAYSVSENVNDTAVYGSLGWVINGAAFSNGTAYSDYGWGDILSVTVFYDYGSGKQRATQAAVVEHIDIDGAGVEVDFRFPDNNAYAKFSLAKPLRFSQANNGEEFQYWISIGIEL